MKELIYKIITDLNKLSEEEDVLIKLSPSTYELVAIQSVNKLVYLTDLLSIIEFKTKKFVIFYLSLEKLIQIKNTLIYFLNNIKDCILVPTKYGFKILTYKEFIHSGILKKKYVVYKDVKIYDNKNLFWIKYYGGQEARELIKILDSVK